MPLLMPGLTDCPLCHELIEPGDKLIGVNPCIPEQTVRTAAMLVPLEGEEAVDLHEWRRQMIHGHIKGTLRLGDQLGWRGKDREAIKQQWLEEREAKFEATTEMVNTDPIQAIVEMLWYHTDSLMHRACYETSPLRTAIDFLRGEARVHVVGGDGIRTDEGEMVLSQERIIEIIEGSES